MAKVTDVLGVVREYLEINRFDGLFCMDGDCACRLEDLAPCGDVCGSCEPGHLYIVKSSSGEEVTWRIMRREDVQVGKDLSLEPGLLLFTGSMWGDMRREDIQMEKKELTVTNMTELKDRVPDVEVFGDPGRWVCLCKASSKSQGWMKSTKAMEVPGGVLIQVSTQQGDHVAEALAFIPEARIVNGDLDMSNWNR